MPPFLRAAFMVTRKMGEEALENRDKGIVFR